MHDYAVFDRLSSAVYIAARAGAVDCTAAFDLAASWLAEHPHDPHATELAALSLECTQDSHAAERPAGDEDAPSSVLDPFARARLRAWRAEDVPLKPQRKSPRGACR